MSKAFRLSVTNPARTLFDTTLAFYFRSA